MSRRRYVTFCNRTQSAYGMQRAAASTYNKISPSTVPKTRLLNETSPPTLLCSHIPYHVLLLYTCTLVTTYETDTSWLVVLMRFDTEKNISGINCIYIAQLLPSNELLIHESTAVMSVLCTKLEVPYSCQVSV